MNIGQQVFQVNSTPSPDWLDTMLDLHLVDADEVDAGWRMLMQDVNLPSGMGYGQADLTDLVDLHPPLAPANDTILIISADIRYDQCFYRSRWA